MAQQARDDVTEMRTKIKEIASPRMVRGLSLGRSPGRRSASRGQSVGSHGGGNDFSSRISSMQMQNQN